MAVNTEKKDDSRLTVLAALLCAVSIFYYVSNTFSDDVEVTAVARLKPGLVAVKASDFQVDENPADAGRCLPPARRSPFEYGGTRNASEGGDDG